MNNEINIIERLAILETKVDTMGSDIKDIKASVGGLKLKVGAVGAIIATGVTLLAAWLSK